MNRTEKRQQARDRRRKLNSDQANATVKAVRVWNGFVLNRATRRGNGVQR